MKVLVTGGTGFVGSHVARQLRVAGYDVRLLVRDQDKARAVYQGLGEAVPELVEGDITDGGSVRSALEGCQGVVHAAAATPVNFGDTTELFRVNVGGAKNVIGKAVDAGLQHIVHLSSLTAIFNTDADKVTEAAPLAHSRMPYGRSKIEAESMVREHQQRGAPVAIVYPGGVIGPDDPGLSDAFKALIHRFNQGFRITEGGMQHVDVRDLAAFIVALMGEQRTAGRYLLPGPWLAWSELADLLERVSGYPLKRIPARGWVFRALGRYYDIKRWFTEVDSPISAETMRYSTLWPNISASAKLSELGLSFRDPEETFQDSLRWLLKAGYLDSEQAPKLAPESTS